MQKDVRAETLHVRTTVLEEAFCACCGAILTTVFLLPFEVVKIRMQTEQKHLLVDSPQHIKGTFDGFRKIARFEGVPRLWSGISAGLVLTVPSTVAFFVLYDQFRHAIKNQYNHNVPKEQQLHPVWIPVAAATGARMFSAWLVSPLELIKTKLQSTSISYGEVRDILTTVIKANGVTVLWKGVYSTLFRDVFFSGLYWTNYENLKVGYCQQVPSFSFSFLAGALSGGIAALVSAPFDVVKTYQQTEVRKGMKRRTDSMHTVVTKILTTYGPRGLFTGVSPRLIKMIPACAIMTSTTETMKTTILIHKIRRSRSELALTQNKTRSE